MNLRIIKERGWVHENQTEFVLTLAKLVLLQLFAPELYRFGKQKMVDFLSQMEEWAKDDDWQSGVFLKEKAFLGAFDKKGAGDDCPFSNRKLERQIQPLVRLWMAARDNRSGFNPDKLINLTHPCDPSTTRYFRMLDEGSAEQIGSAHLTMPGIQASGLAHATNDDVELPDNFSVGNKKKSSGKKLEIEERGTVNLSPPDLDERATPDDLLLFLDGLFSGDALQMRGAFEQEKERLQGRAFAPEFFERLLRRVEKQPEIVDVNWLQTVEPYLSFRQLSKLYEQTGLLERLAGEVRE